MSACLHESAEYERVVIWSEHDCYDQLTLIRLLGHFALHRCPSQLELINTGNFPGAKRFIGLGELPPEALRMLWTTRKRASPAQLQLGLKAWSALVNPDPRPPCVHNAERYARAAAARPCPASPPTGTALYRQWPFAHRGDGTVIAGQGAGQLHSHDGQNVLRL